MKDNCNWSEVICTVLCTVIMCFFRKKTLISNWNITFGSTKYILSHKLLISTQSDGGSTHPPTSQYLSSTNCTKCPQFFNLFVVQSFQHIIERKTTFFHPDMCKLHKKVFFSFSQFCSIYLPDKVIDYLGPGNFTRKLDACECPVFNLLRSSIMRQKRSPGLTCVSYRKLYQIIQCLWMSDIQYITSAIIQSS